MSKKAAARKAGIIPEDEVTPEMNAASIAVVKQELKKQGK